MTIPRGLSPFEGLGPTNEQAPPRSFSLKKIALGLLIISVPVLLLFGTTFFVFAVVEITDKLSTVLISALLVAVAVCILVLLPLSAFSSTRKVACHGFQLASYIF
jgi:hypothetical protein